MSGRGFSRAARIAAAGALALAACSRAPEGPNVLLVSIDSLRADHLSCYGAARETSPSLARIAREGVLFENHFSSTSWTLPAHAALFTSLPDSLHGCTDTDRVLSGEAVTLAERFRDAGYATAGFYSGPYLHPAFGLSQGFESYEDCSSYPELMAHTARAGSEEETINEASHADVTGGRVEAAVERWLDGRPKGPFFLFVHLWDVHFDYIPPPPFDTKFDPDYRGEISGHDFLRDPRIHAGMDPRDLEHQIALYDGEIAWTDSVVGRIRARLEKEGLLDQTIVAITSDHGDEFFEHGNKTHRLTVYDEVVHVPLLLRYPAALAAGVRVTAETRSIDVGPTLLELAGRKVEGAVVGRSLLPLVRGGGPDPGGADPPRPAWCELFTGYRSLRSLRTLRFKYVEDFDRDRSYFFDLERDPGEQIPRADFESDLGKEARAAYLAELGKLAAFAKEHPVPGGADSPAPGGAVPPEVLEQLKRLGYVDEGGPGGR